MLPRQEQVYPSRHLYLLLGIGLSGKPWLSLFPCLRKVCLLFLLHHTEVNELPYILCPRSLQVRLLTLFYLCLPYQICRLVLLSLLSVLIEAAFEELQVLSRSCLMNLPFFNASCLVIYVNRL